MWLRGLTDVDTRVTIDNLHIKEAESGEVIRNSWMNHKVVVYIYTPLAILLHETLDLCRYGGNSWTFDKKYMKACTPLIPVNVQPDVVLCLVCLLHLPMSTFFTNWVLCSTTTCTSYVFIDFHNVALKSRGTLIFWHKRPNGFTQI